jgi:hypothetical protein
MKKHLISAVSLVLLTSAFLSPAMAAGPRASDSNDWPGMSQSANSGYFPGSRPDAAAKCGVYDSYCYYNGRLSLDNTGRNR